MLSQQRPSHSTGSILKTSLTVIRPLYRHLDTMLVTLPNEILHTIFNSFATSPKLIHADDDDNNYYYHLDNWTTLAHLCRVSRRIRYIAEPLLYRNYSKRSTIWHPHEHSLRIFLTTLFERPELLQHVRSLYIGAWSQQCLTCLTLKKKKKMPCSSGLYSIYSEHVRSSALDDGWREALKAGEEAAEIALLMSLTPNLEHIEFHMSDMRSPEIYIPQYFWPGLLVASAGWDPACHFRRLRSVMVHRRHLGFDYREKEWYGYNYSVGSYFVFEIDPFLTFVGLPSLRVLQIENKNWTPWRSRPEVYPLNDEESHLSDLTLDFSVVNPMKIIQILERCTKLEALHLEQHSTILAGCPEYTWKTIREALNNSRGTLQELTLDAKVFFRKSDSIGSLTGFASLRKLVISQSAFLKFKPSEEYTTLGVSPPLEEILPCSLESLTIKDCFGNLVPYLEDLSIKLEDKFPHLREIRLIDATDDRSEVSEDSDDDLEILAKSPHRMDCLKEAFSTAGVRYLQA
ncbi:hypothetical protein M436DRAFT_66265 [Aureobasidium namibiae CBS 147.97]|uniref:Uncharacterized protein n=1 Tax=Aureobasidium namibiae CBS 147.97 TaxID=1043004 RepID=A0A074WBL8_9PEZI|nr:uncharacterized protein M436DRAFT_66265 [Aureobasidium namibiae CBS 147.97]KEQ70343.1 hypothetical protein M436DRAFT_66265 [Aureobasidium namibiae CBS 147.97]